MTEPDVDDPSSEIDPDAEFESGPDVADDQGDSEPESGSDAEPDSYDSVAGEGSVEDDDLDFDELVTAEDLAADDDDLDFDFDDELVTAADLDDDYDEAAALFDGDPDEFELELGGEIYPDSRPQPGDVILLDDPDPAGPIPPRRMSRVERRRRVRLQARRVRRIVRHVEPWSVLKMSIFFYACLWVIFLVAGFMIWGVAESSGTVDKLEDLIIDLFALDSFDFDAGQIFRGYALGGLALSIAGTTFNVLMSLLFNLISDLTGGLRITMIEEETARPTPPRRRRRRPPARR